MILPGTPWFSLYAWSHLYELDGGGNLSSIVGDFNNHSYHGMVPYHGPKNPQELDLQAQFIGQRKTLSDQEREEIKVLKPW